MVDSGYPPDVTVQELPASHRSEPTAGKARGQERYQSLAFAAVCCAQDDLVSVNSKGKQRVSSSGVNKIYLSACSAVQREFADGNALRPRIALVLGADKDVVDFDRKRILLKRWDRDLFAEGVVILAFEDLLTPQRRTIMTNRAVSWADATIDVTEMHR